MRPPWLSRWLPGIVGLAAGLLLARLVMDAVSGIEPAPASPFVLGAGYLTCVLTALAVTISWRRISAGGRVRSDPVADGPSDDAGDPTSPPDRTDPPPGPDSTSDNSGSQQ